MGLIQVSEARPAPGLSLPPEITHLSPSAFGLWLKCQEQFRLRYIKGLKERPGVALVLGDATWGAQVEGNFRQKIKTGADAPVNDVIEAYDAEFKRSVESKGGEGEIKWDTDQNDAHVLGLKMAEHYRATVAPYFQPQAVETEMTVYVDGLNVPLFGYLDMVCEDTVVEAKTSKTKVSKLKPEWRLQGSIYQLAEPKKVDWHVITKTKKPRIWTPQGSTDPQKPEESEPLALSVPYDEVKVAHTKRFVRQLAAQIKHTYQTFGPDEPWPTTGTAHTFACDWCAWRKNCPAWRAT